MILTKEWLFFYFFTKSHIRPEASLTLAPAETHKGCQSPMDGIASALNKKFVLSIRLSLAIIFNEITV